MKNKILLSTLLGSALLVGCTADDALDVKKNVAEGVNPAAPVFTVSFGDELTRATMATDGVNAMTWESIDKMSLFHGGGSAANVHEKNDDSNFLASGKVMNLNAIYGMSGGEGQTPEFTTASMVTEGLAIMVYPADTTFTQIGVNPIISLTMDQNSNTKNLTPHISEVLDITAHGSLDDEEEDNSHSAGYGRKYDLIMRQIGSQLRLTLNGENAGVEGIEFRKVTMTVEDITKSPFTKELEVKVGQPRRNVKEDGTLGEGSEKVGANTADHKYWKYSPWLEPAEDGGRSKYISTTDIENGKTAIFTLLPYEDRPEEEYNAPFEAGVAQYGDVTIKVETNFGWVEVKDDGESKLWSNKAGTKQAINEGLAAVLQALFKANAEGDGLYSGQLFGKGGERFLNVDLSDLNMNGLHVRDEVDLIKVLDVYDTLKKGQSDDKVTFILDGNDDERFVMTKDTWVALEQRLAEEGNNVSFALCNDEASCKAVVLDNTGNDAAEVPALQFVTEVDDETVAEEVVIELAGDWKYTSVVDEKTKKNFEGVSEIVVLDGTLGLDNTIGTTTSNLKITIENGAVAEVLGAKVVLDMNMDNKGTIKIGEKKTFRLDGENTLTNLESGKDKATGLTVEGAGLIEIGEEATLGAIDGTGARSKIYNYGIIKADGTANVFITSNARTNTSVSDVFAASTKAIGTIDLDESLGDAQKISVKDAINTTSGKLDRTHAAYGFVKTRVKTSVDTKVEAYGSVANYIILKDGSDGINNSEAVAATKKAIPEYVKYIEVASGKEVSFVGTFTLNGLIIAEGEKAFVGQGYSLTVSGDAYVKGDITNGGTVTITNFDKYFGGKSTDKNNITTLPGASN